MKMQTAKGNIVDVEVLASGKLSVRFENNILECPCSFLGSQLFYLDTDETEKTLVESGTGRSIKRSIVPKVECDCIITLQNIDLPDKIERYYVSEAHRTEKYLGMKHTAFGTYGAATQTLYDSPAGKMYDDCTEYISNIGAIGKAVIGHRLKDLVTVKLPNGESVRYKIVRIEKVNYNK